MSVRLVLLLFLSTLAVASAPTSTDSNAESGETPKRLMTVPDSVRIPMLVVSTLLVDLLSALTVYKLWPERFSSFDKFLKLLPEFLTTLGAIFNLSWSSTGGKFPAREVMFFSIIGFVVSTTVVLGIGVAMKKSWQIVVASLATFMTGVIAYLSVEETTWMVVATTIPIFLSHRTRQWPYLTNILPVATTTIINLQLINGIFTTLAHGESLLWPLLPAMMVMSLLHFCIQPALMSYVLDEPLDHIENHQNVIKFQLVLFIGHILLLIIACMVALVYTFYLE